jgi:hypothetical protein
MVMSISLSEAAIINPEGEIGVTTFARRTSLIFQGYRISDLDTHEAFDGLITKTYIANVSGQNDLIAGGSYNGSALNKTFYVGIDSAGTNDTFTWSFNSDLSSPEETGIPCSGVPRELVNGVTVNFATSTGHSVGDKWQLDYSIDLDKAHDLVRFTGTHGGYADDVSGRLDLYVNRATVNDISVTQYSGSGLNDLTAAGYQLRLLQQTYYVKISYAGTGSSDPDKFVWSTNSNFPSYNTSIERQIQNNVYFGLEDGLTVRFTNNTGHTLGDIWRVIFTPDKAMTIHANNTTEIYGTLVNDGAKVGLKIYNSAGTLLNGA